ncbi:hypothetical protein [Flammeovirga sp. OC4]|uniref:hypothetical protein n=1 Tax=Flammeovirga sp. OC4 TaxID=1382345 RepID=UPI0005C793F0|nr:hypothetical protein [Flammeovirga sp. OC4]
MAFPKKGSRNIEVDGIRFQYKISKLKPISDWRQEGNELNDNFKKYAQQYGLGSVRDATINVVIQSMDNSVSSMFIKCHTLLIDGFLGPEQVIQIKPNQVSQLIRKGLNDGWNPNKKGDYRLELAQKWTN